MSDQPRPPGHQHLVLVHHGAAVGPDVDPMRPLSSPGREATARLAAAAAARGIKPDAVWHSGKLRARQTAELFWSACNPLASLSARRGLQPDDPPFWVADQLVGETSSILIAGHMPFLPRLLGRLLDGPVDGATRSFPQHGCVCLVPDGTRWVEVWRLAG